MYFESRNNLKKTHFRLPIESRKRGARFVSLLVLFFLLSLLSLTKNHVWAQNSDFDPMIFRILYVPKIAEATTQRQEATKSRDSWGPLKASRLDGPGFHIKTVDQNVSLSDLKSAEQDLKAHSPHARFSGAEIVLARALAPMMAMQIRASDWYPRLSSERLQFAFEVFQHYAHRATKKEKYLGRRHYVLNQITEGLQLPFNLNDFVLHGRFQSDRLEQYFSGILNLLEQGNEDAEQEFRDYLFGLATKLRAAIDPRGLRVSWQEYRIFEDTQAPLQIETADLETSEDLQSIRLVIEQLCERAIAAAKTLPKVAWEDYYAFIYADQGFELNYNSAPGSYLTSRRLDLGESSLPAMRIELNPETIEISELGIKKVIFDQVNPFYLTEAFRREFAQRLIEAPRNPFDEKPSFGRAFHRKEAHRSDIENLYAERLQDPLHRIDLAKSWRFRWWQAAIPLPEDFDESLLSSYYRELYDEQMRMLQQELRPLYESEARQAGYEDVNEAATQGFSFSNSLRHLPELRAEAFQRMIARMSDRLMMAEALIENPQLEGPLSSINEGLVLSLSAQAKAVGRTLTEFAAREIQSHRQALPLHNFVKVTEGSDQLIIWMPEQIEITDLIDLYGDDHDLYFEYEKEITDQRTLAAYLIGIEEFVDPQIQYFDGRGTDWEDKLPSSQEELMDALRPESALRVLELAALIEHRRCLREDRWWQNDFRTRYR